MENPPAQKPHAPSYDPELARPNHSKPGFGKWILLLIALAVVIGAGFWFRSRSAAKAKPTAQPGRGGANFGPIPVVAGNAITKDVPIYLDGLGTVQAFNTVTVRPRVDGQILK